MAEPKRSSSVRWGLVLGGIAAILLVSLGLLWFAAPTIAQWQIESQLREGGFEVVRTEMDGLGWRKITASRLVAKSNHSTMEAMNATFAYSLFGFLRGQAERLTVEKITFSYEAEDWPEWAELANEFPLLEEERDPEEPPFADRITVREGYISLVIGDGDANLQIELSVEAPGPGRWNGWLEAAGAGMEMVVAFRSDTIKEEGEFEVSDLKVDAPALVETARNFRSDAALQDWHLSGDKGDFRGEGHWKEGRLSWDLKGSIPNITLEGEEVEMTVAASTFQIQGNVEEVRDDWSVALETTIDAEVQSGNFHDRLHIDLAARAKPIEQWNGVVHLTANTAILPLSFEADLERWRASVEVRDGSLQPELSREMLFAFTKAEGLRLWRIHSDPLLIDGVGEWVDGRFSWKLEAELNFADVGKPGTRIIIREGSLEGEGILERLPEHWRISFDAAALADSFTFNDTQLLDPSGAWSGDLRNGHLSFAGIRQSDRLPMEGDIAFRKVNEEWEIEPDIRIDLFQELP